MKIKIISVIILFSIIPIFSFAQEFVVFGAKEKYYLAENEKNLNIDSAVLAEYNPLNASLIHQVPLNRYIIGNNYKLFIGLAIFDVPQKLIEYYKTNYHILKTDEQVIKKNNYYKLLCKTGDFYNYKIIFLTRKSRYTVVLNYLSVDSNLIESFYNDPNFINLKFKRTKKYIK